MAAAFYIRNLHASLGFSTRSTTTITDDQVIDNQDTFKILHGNDFENLCKYIHCPGSKIFGQGRVDIPNLRIPVSIQATMNLTITTY